MTVICTPNFRQCDKSESNLYQMYRVSPTCRARLGPSDSLAETTLLLSVAARSQPAPPGGEHYVIIIIIQKVAPHVYAFPHFLSSGGIGIPNQFTSTAHCHPALEANSTTIHINYTISWAPHNFILLSLQRHNHYLSQ